jgi:RNA polymerase sigma-70 factor (ECF subfamily)
MSQPETFPETRPSLLMRLRDRGDNQAWSDFIDVYSPLIYGFLRRRGLQESDAADVAQEVLTRVARAMPEFGYDRDRGRFRDWLWTVTRNEVRRHWTARGRQVAEVPLAGDSVLETLASDGWTAEWNDEFQRHILNTALQRICSSFEPRTWQAFTRVWLQNNSAVEVAAALNAPVDFVYVAKSRVLKQLREEVLRLADDGVIAAP